MDWWIDGLLETDARPWIVRASPVAAVVKPRSLLHALDPPIHIGGYAVHGSNARQMLGRRLPMNPPGESECGRPRPQQLVAN